MANDLKAHPCSSRLSSNLIELSGEIRLKKKIESISESKSSIMASFINNELNEWINLNCNDAGIHFLRATICDDLLHQKCKALYEIMRAEECSLSVALKFQIFSMKSKIRKELLQEDMKKEINSRNSFSRFVRY